MEGLSIKMNHKKLGGITIKTVPFIWNRGVFAYFDNSILGLTLGGHNFYGNARIHLSLQIYGD
mgnify:CR=1 FL=1